MKFIVVLSILFLTNWCSNLNKNGNEEPLARVGDNFLYPTELKGLIKAGISKDDSISMIRGLTEKWIRKQLILEKAVMNLTDEEKNVEKELDEYRTSLIIYKYEQKLVKERLDTAVTNGEMSKYYNDNPQNFILNNNIVKVHFIKLPIDAPKKDLLKNWMKVEHEDNIKLLEEYCYKYAVKYDYFNDSWVNFDNIKMLFPYNAELGSQPLSVNKILEANDSVFYYLLNIRDLQLKGSVAPYAYVEGDIKNILVLKRKQKLIYDLENKIYFDAMNKNNFKIFNN